jgi:5-methylcytosine-specific restriction protein A
MSYVDEYRYEGHDGTTAPGDNANNREAIRFRLVPVGGTEIEVGQELDAAASVKELFNLYRQPTRWTPKSSRK